MLHISVLSSWIAPRPAVRLAIVTLSRRMDAVEPEVFDGLSGFLIGVATVGKGEKPHRANPAEPGRIGHRRVSGLLTTDIVYDETVLGRAPSNRTCLAQFVERVERAMDKLIAWCDRKAVWADRATLLDVWSATRDDLAAARFVRPYEFAATPAERDTLDDHWQKAASSDIDDPGFDAAMKSYYKTRDRFWEGADYAADPSQPEGRFGQPCLVANYAQNIATARPPSARECYSVY